MADWSKVGRRSRRKGKAHECEIARVLRRASACEWQTVRNSGRTDLAGDVYSPGGFCDHVMIECKHRETFELAAMVQGHAAYVQEMVKVVCEDWGRRPQHVLVVFVKNSLGLWAMAVTKDKQRFVSTQQAALVRCAARWTWNYVGKGEDNQGRSPVIAELFRWLVARHGQGSHAGQSGHGAVVGGA